MDPKKVCQVCGSYAKPKEIYFAHYGGITCLSCKAFFRRVIREKKNLEEFECKTSGQCDLLNSKGAKCKKCRYYQCLKAGMQPNLVPNEEESKKFTFPKKNCGGSAKLRLTSKTAALDEVLCNFSTCWIFNDKATSLVIAHQIPLWNASSTLAFLDILDMHVMATVAFAQKSSTFNWLSIHDQRLLLNNNSKLFTQYMMAKYFSAENGFDQLVWILGSNLPHLGNDDRAKLAFFTFDQINSNGCLIPLDRPNQIRAYKENLEVFRRMSTFPSICNAPIASYLLYSSGHWRPEDQMSLGDPSKVKSMSDFSAELLRYGCQGNQKEQEDRFSPAFLLKLALTLHNLDECMGASSRGTFSHHGREASKEAAKMPSDVSNDTGSHKMYSFLMDTIMSSYAMTDLEMNIDHFSEHGVIAGHLGSTWTADHSESFCQLINHLPQFISKFAHDDSYFLSLCGDDQALLLSKNSELIVQYHLARYFGAVNGLDQLIWALGSHLPQLTLQEIQGLNWISFDTINQDGKLISLSCTMAIEQYKKLIEQINEQCEFSQFHNCFLAHYIIFATSHWTIEEESRLKEPKRIQWINEMSAKIINHGCRHMDAILGQASLGQLVASLSQMAELKAKNDKIGYALTTQNLTPAEQDCINQCLSFRKNAEALYQLDANFVGLMVAFQRGEHHLRPQLNFCGTNIQLSRFGVVIDQVLPQLKAAERHSIAVLTCRKAALMLFSKMVELSTFRLQLELMAASPDILAQTWIDDIPPLLMNEMSGFASLIKKFEWRLMSQLRGCINQFLSTREIIILAEFLILTGDDDSSEVVRLNQFLRGITLKKLREMHKGEDPRMKLAIFFQNLSEYAQVMRKFMEESDVQKPQ